MLSTNPSNEKGADNITNCNMITLKHNKTGNNNSSFDTDNNEDMERFIKNIQAVAVILCLTQLKFSCFPFIQRVIYTYP